MVETVQTKNSMSGNIGVKRSMVNLEKGVSITERREWVRSD